MSIVCLHFDYFLLIKRFRFLYKNITDCVSHNICPSRLLLKKCFIIRSLSSIIVCDFNIFYPIFSSFSLKLSIGFLT